MVTTDAGHSQRNDRIAQAVCTAVRKSAGAVAASRKNCGDPHLNCHTACLVAASSMKKISGNYGGRFEGSCIDFNLRENNGVLTHPKCFKAFHVYDSKKLNSGEVYKASHVVYKYGTEGCDTYTCGPNYCCCVY